MIDEERVIEHRARALYPDHPVIRGTAQIRHVISSPRDGKPTVRGCPHIVAADDGRFADLTGRRGRLRSNITAGTRCRARDRFDGLRLRGGA